MDSIRVLYLILILFVFICCVASNGTKMSKCMAFASNKDKDRGTRSQANFNYKKAMDNRVIDAFRACLLNEEGFRFKKTSKIKDFAQIKSSRVKINAST
ncbi:unnamed protein product [Oppiella nova]|uniref:Uncharacterized protein n=1 Tax=Oppiella nova TaxID=334625 RepID=A0A7R9LRT6_9ACAR|nr:unnamed protein product [Oppiella nova]CAG2166326.1 unnamed protein product [Oppiella nova]